ncbi:MAG TPA: hypothetical protein VFR38_00680 [Gaiellaceae bacterium]|nr:hypothetical protein [Gaiellaceae bacterium]
MSNEFTLMDATAKLVAVGTFSAGSSAWCSSVGLAVQMVGNLAAL